MSIRYTLNYDSFMDRAYSGPFIIDGIDLDTVDCLRTFYIQKLLECSTIDQMKTVTDKFSWLASDARLTLDSVLDISLPRLKRLMHDSRKVVCMQLAPILAPHVMVRAHILGNKYCIPEHIAAIQYFGSLLFVRDKEKIQS